MKDSTKGDGRQKSTTTPEPEREKIMAEHALGPVEAGNAE